MILNLVILSKTILDCLKISLTISHKIPICTYHYMSLSNDNKWYYIKQIIIRISKKLIHIQLAKIAF